MKPLKNKVYRLVHKATGKVLDVSGGIEDKPSNFIVSDWHGGDNQRFVFYELDGGYFGIAAKHSGMVMDVREWSTAAGAGIHQHPWHGMDNQLWIVEDRGNGYVSLKSKNSGLTARIFDAQQYLLSLGLGVGIMIGGALVEALKWTIVQGQYDGSDAFLWKLEEVGEFGVPSTVSTQKLPDIPQYTSYEDNLPSRTEPVTVASTVIPAVMVNDTWNKVQVLRESPYYLLIKKQYWKKVDSQVFVPNRKYVSKVTYGMSRTDQQSMTERTGISVTADAGFSFKGFSASLSTTVTRELEVSKSTSVELMVEYVFEEEITNPKDHRVAWSKYILETEFTLLRTDGTMVSNPWTVSNNRESRETYWPMTRSAETLSRSLL